MNGTVLTIGLVAGALMQGATMSHGQAEGDLTARVKAQLAARPGLPPGAAVAWYAVPALSPVKRLPDAFPADGVPGGALQVAACRGEFEPASFLLFPFQTSSRAELKAADLASADGVIPASCVDVKVVKCWYQAGTAWYSYFADVNGRQLTPELLLNDESLVRIDERTKDNYLRVDEPAGTNYVWVSNPAAVEAPLNEEVAPVADGKSLQPFRLEAGAFKQFWVTVKIPETAAPGLYRGSLTLSGAGPALAIPLAVRVLPFDLPAPATYYDAGREFYSMLYNDPGYADILKKNGNDWAHADRKMLALFKNMRDHNVLHPRIDDYRAPARDAFIRTFELMREAGLSTDPIFGAIPGIPPYGWMTSMVDVAVSNQTLPAELVSRVDESYDIVKKLLGHSNVYCFGWDEPSRRLVVAERKPWTYLHDKGLKVYSTATDSHLSYSGYNEDFVNVPGGITRERAAAWHAMGQRIMNYASPHTGPENPDFIRRVHGLKLYKANYDGLGNYILSCRGWNDFIGESYNFRLFNMTYPTRDGVIDTLAWEGTREALDDVRYATLLKIMAARAVATGKTGAVYEGRRALQWLERMDETSADLDAVRLEMIDRILALRAHAAYPPAETKPASVKAPPLPAAVAVATSAVPETVESIRAVLTRPKVTNKDYRAASFRLIELTALEGRQEEARADAAAVAADSRLAPADRFTAGMMAAGLEAEVSAERLAKAAGALAAAVTNGPLAAEVRLAGLHEAGKLFMKMRRYDTVRAFLGAADGLRLKEERNTYHCRYLPKAPVTAEGWLASPFLKEPKNRESRFAPYNRKAAELLVNDVNVERAVAQADGPGAETGFYMAWDEAGIHLFVACKDPEAERVQAGLLGAGQLELFLVPGIGNCYYQWFASFPKSDVRAVAWDSRHSGYRPLEDYLRTDSSIMDGGYGVSVFIPWEAVYDKLPSEGDAWPFTIIRWARSGGVTWGGKVHNITDFGRVTWEGMTPARVNAIRRPIVLKALSNYQKAKGDLAVFWKDEVLGDPVFYAASLKPLVESLDEYAKKVAPEMSAADVDLLFEKAVGDWMEFPHRVSALRRAYLQGRIANSE